MLLLLALGRNGLLRPRKCWVQMDRVAIGFSIRVVIWDAWKDAVRSEAAVKARLVPLTKPESILTVDTTVLGMPRRDTHASISS